MRIYFHTFGCKANQYDTERMRQELEARGASSVPAAEDADVCVINTCTVTNRADAEARRTIRRLRRQNPTLKVLVAGCSAALKSDEYRGMSGVAAVVPGQDSVQVAQAVAGLGGTRLIQMGTSRGLDQMDLEPVGGEILTQRAGATRGWLKIQDGCDRRCSFCATRLARGKSRSRTPDEVIREALVLGERHPELVLTGIHIGHYGLDLPQPVTLSRLVVRLLQEVPNVRFRLGSIEATEVDDVLMESLAGSDGRLAPHIHMPLQSGADPVLRRMRRWHTREMYRTRALQIADRLPVLGLGADVITGFPGETADDHCRTRELIEELPFTYLHVFPFSPRDGTSAATLPDPVPQRVAGERARDLRELVHAKGQSYRRRRAGTSAMVALEGGGRLGLTEDYLRVPVDSTTPAPSGLLHSVALEARGDDLIARLEVSA